jgi:E3 SUMO-protein ligase PIAS1
MSASTATTITRENAASLIRFVNSSLIVRQLQTVLKLEGQPTSGLKAPLQKRLTNRKFPFVLNASRKHWYYLDIETIVKNNDVQAFERVKNHVYNPDAPHAPARAVSGSSYPPFSNGYSPTPAGRTNPPTYTPASGSFALTSHTPPFFQPCWTEYPD